MSNFKAIRPEDILKDGEDFVPGTTARKGSIAAFLKNVEVLENPNTDKEVSDAAIKIMQELAPVLVSLNFHKHAVFKNPVVQKILMDAVSEL